MVPEAIDASGKRYNPSLALSSRSRPVDGSIVPRSQSQCEDRHPALEDGAEDVVESEVPPWTGLRGPPARGVDVDRAAAGAGAGEHETVAASRGPGPHHRPARREVSVFVSGPFQDTASEFDAIRRRAAPRLRALCAERGVFFQLVDLRWGVSRDEVRRGELLVRCIREAQRATYFVGLLKGRYGRRLANPGASSLKPSEERIMQRSLAQAESEYPWVRACRDQSLTEVEMRAAALNDPAAARERSLFYFAEGQPGSPADADGSRRVAALKEEIRGAGMRVAGFEGPEDLAASLADDLAGLIEKDYPLEALPWLEAERAQQASFAEGRRRCFCGDESDAEALDAYASGSGPEREILPSLPWLTGPAGRAGGRRLAEEAAARWPALPQLDWRGCDAELALQISVSLSRSRRTIFFEAQGRSLDKEPLDRIVSSPACGNALFLTTLLEDLSTCATGAELEARLEARLALRGPAELYRALLEDLRRRHGRLVAEATGALLCCRHGLAEAELAAFVGAGELERGGPSEEEWAELWYHLHPMLAPRDGLYGFLHRCAAEAVAEAFGLRDEAGPARTALYARLGDFFARSEAPWALARAGPGAGARGRLAELLCCPDVVRRLDLYETAELWRQSGEAAGAAARFAARAGPGLGTDPAHLVRVGETLERIGRASDGTPFLQRALELLEGGGAGPDGPQPRLEAASVRLHLGRLYHVQVR
eukprot:tig00000158_g10124.t1